MYLLEKKQDSDNKNQEPNRGSLGHMFVGVCIWPLGFFGLLVGTSGGFYFGFPAWLLTACAGILFIGLFIVFFQTILLYKYARWKNASGS